MKLTNLFLTLSLGSLLALPAGLHALLRNQPDSTEQAEAIKMEQEATEPQTLDAIIQGLCGENAGGYLLESGRVQCLTKQGHKTKTVGLPSH